MYNSVLVTKLVNSVMLDGKKRVLLRRSCTMLFDIIKRKRPARNRLTRLPKP